jgi:hypothetical protein
MNQVRKYVYTALTITMSVNGTTRMPHRLSGIIYVEVTIEKYTLSNDLALGTVAGSAVIIIS